MPAGNHTIASLLVFRERKVISYLLALIFLSTHLTSYPQTQRGKAMQMHRIPLADEKKSQSGSSLNSIIFLSRQPYPDAPVQIRSAYDSASRISEYSWKFVTFRDFERGWKKTAKNAVAWIHLPDTGNTGIEFFRPDWLTALRQFVGEGGKVLLTMQAAKLINAMDIEPVILTDSLKVCRDDGFGRRLGFHAFRDHPLFAGMNGGAYIQRPDQDIQTTICGFFGNSVPANGKVVAVDWDYIFLRENTKLILEYSYGKGHILVVGAYMDFLQPNRNPEHLKMFTSNCLKYLSSPGQDTNAFYWNYEPRKVSECKDLPEYDRPVITSPAEQWDIPETGNTLRRRHATGNFWDIAGERMLTMGSEKGGIEELWSHPFMALRDYEAGIRFSNMDTIFWLNDERPEISVDPASFTRQYRFSRAYLKEVIVNDPEEPAGIVHYEYRGVYPAELILRFRSNLRWMWPYSEQVTGSMCFKWNSAVNALLIRDYSGDLNVMIGADKTPLQHKEGAFSRFDGSGRRRDFEGVPTEEPMVSGLIVYKLHMNDNLDMVITASSEGYDKTLGSYLSALKSPVEIFRKANRFNDSTLMKNLMITTPDSVFNTGYRWAMIAASRFFIHTPGMGKALAAGYSTTKRGWDGGHAINGRPGYGWYFGRDAQWSGFAFLDVGDHEKVKHQLEFFNKFQDLNGKIFHEASTSGLIHYDAADATPLYIVLAGKYFRHSADTAFIRKAYPNIKKAVNFCFSTDTDHDHLIENTNVGHGWVEGGKLYGSHSTIYMAGSWGAALREMSTMAAFMNDPEKERYLTESSEQQYLIDHRFWNDELRFYAYGMDKDRSFRNTPTILPAVPVYFRRTDRKKATACVKAYAGNAFTTNWGARILREDHPWFRPGGYHYGSVWPLFTGWASLAEYFTGQAVPGYSHLMNNLTLYRQWGLGFTEEVLHGAEFSPSGVCPHQCWSETMVLQPAIEGMLGIDWDAPQQRLTMAPNLPVHWDSITVQGIRLKDQRAGMKFERKNGGYEYSFTLDRGEPVTIEFMPELPAGTMILGVTLNGQEVPVTTFKSPQSVCAIVVFRLTSAATLRIETQGGVGILPLVARPQPGDPAQGPRITSIVWKNEKYVVEMEGVAGSSGQAEFWSATASPLKDENGHPGLHSGHITRFRVDFPKSEAKYSFTTLTIPITGSD